MMATMTALRSTPHVNLAHAQSKAPVHEFRCMYSHDRRKKKKTWHDGSLHFHTFNKVVRVYDESKNYIGNLHRRVSDDVQEGEELELDKGILVEVGERLATTETDLAPLFERRQPENRSSPMRPPLRPITQTSVPGTAGTFNSQMPAKSLSAVLGISRGRIGRARLPEQSPYERRHEIGQTSIQKEEPPAKRARIGLGRQYLNDSRDVFSLHRQTSEQISSMQPSTVLSPPLREKRSNLKQKHVIEISSEASPVQIPILSSSLPAKEQPIENAMRGQNQDSDRERQSIDDTPIPKSRTERLPAQKAKKSVVEIFQAQRDSGRSFVSGEASSTRSKMTKLRLASSKPRKKLLYRDLLPSSKLHRKANEELNYQKRGNVDDRTSQDEDIVDVVIESDNEALLAETPTSNRAQVADVEVDGSPLKPWTQLQPYSPMFFPQSPSREDQGDIWESSQGDFLLPMVSQNTNTANMPSRDERGLARSSGRLSVNADLHGPIIVSPVRPVTASGQHSLGLQQNASLLSSPTNQAPRLPRPFLRTVSENDSPSKEKSVEMTQIRTEASKDTRTISVGPQNGPKLANRSTKLLRSISDPCGPAKPKPALAKDLDPVVEEVDQDLGPWSKTEAFLLFDWRPPGREMIDIAIPQSDENEQIVARRGFLSDQIDAL